MRRILTLAYGIGSYAVGMAGLVYMIGWLGNFAVPQSIDSPAHAGPRPAIAVNLALVAIFAIQHSVMARPKFKAWLTKFIPEATERSTYILLSGVAVLVMMILWQPVGGEIWDVEHHVGRAALYVLYGVGWATLVGSTFALNHFDLFGLRQTWLAFRGRPYTHLKFATPGIYRMVRHPIYVGWLILAWATPTMTVTHLAFAGLMTAYILIAIQFEERDLVSFHGDKYRTYRAKTPMLVPRLTSLSETTSTDALQA